MNKITSYFAKTSSTPQKEIVQASKKQKINEDEAKEIVETTTEQNLEKKFLDRLKAVETTNSAISSVQICGIYSEDEDEDDENPERVYTAEQLNQLRYILITKKRENALNVATKFVTGGRRGDFSTNSGNLIIMGMPKEIDKAMKKKVVSDQFDALFALTFVLYKHDMWMCDNELYSMDGEDGELDIAVRKLSTAWKGLFAKTNTALGIDAEFSRPGLDALLDKFAQSLDSTHIMKADFIWK